MADQATAVYPMSLRKEKAARLKVQILQQTLGMVGTNSFENLYVEDLCEKVKISKVTFFKYFPKKEDLLLYYMRIWCLKQSAYLRDKAEEGLKAIYGIFDRLSEEYDKHPGMWHSLIGYLSNSNRTPKPYPVRMEEKSFLFPDIPNVRTVEILSLDQMMERFTLEAIFRKEITKSTSTRDITNLLMSILFGSIVAMHVNQIKSAGQLFAQNLDNAVRGLQ